MGFETAVEGAGVVAGDPTLEAAFGAATTRCDDLLRDGGSIGGGLGGRGAREREEEPRAEECPSDHTGTGGRYSMSAICAAHPPEWTPGT